MILFIGLFVFHEKGRIHLEAELCPNGNKIFGKVLVFYQLRNG